MRHPSPEVASVAEAQLEQVKTELSAERARHASVLAAKDEQIRNAAIELGTHKIAL